MAQCSVCGAEDDDLRFGVCFACAEAGERRAAQRTVRQHLGTAVRNLWRGKLTYARYDLTWAWQRLTKTGDYAPGGTFEQDYGLK